MEFDHKKIEKKYQDKWEASNKPEKKTKDKKYILSEFPYPSGDLHVGHWYAFAVPDIYVRYLRATTGRVIYPIGFDSFGLPAENAAIKNGNDPKEWTNSNIEYMRKQLRSIGASFDWEREVVTSDPEYYKHTQWIFSQLFKNNLVERRDREANWCVSCNTVIADEQVTSFGNCERCGSEIEKKKVKQWFLKITDYAEKLLDGLDKLEWPEEIKEQQRNWIGKSEGFEIPFDIEGVKQSVFTTRPDTLFGVTFLAIAPEHPLLDNLEYKNKKEISEYIKEAGTKKEFERIKEADKKTGICIEGVSAIHPITKKEVPIYVAEYVVCSYGTGLVMGVPAHDARDYAFAMTYDLPVVSVIDSEELPSDGKGVLCNSGEYDGEHSDTAAAKIAKSAKGKAKTTYRLNDWSISRQRYWGCPIPIVYDKEGNPHLIPEEHFPWILPDDVKDFSMEGAPLAQSKELKKRVEDVFGKGWVPEYETMDTFLDSTWYYLRYIDPKNKEELASKKEIENWYPVDQYFGGSEHTTLHLLYSRFITKALYDLKILPSSEPYTKRLNRGFILGTNGEKMSKSKGNVVSPDEYVERVGSDSVRMYLAFLGPYNSGQNYPWDVHGILGIRRFLDRVYSFKPEGTSSANVREVANETLIKVSSDIVSFKFNTAISAMMSALKVFQTEGVGEKEYCSLIRILAPFAPHLCEEIWSKYMDGSVHDAPWPKATDEISAQVTIAVQVNGKTKKTFDIGKNAKEDEVMAEAEKVLSFDKKALKRVVFVPDRVINLIIE